MYTNTNVYCLYILLTCNKQARDNYQVLGQRKKRKNGNYNYNTLNLIVHQKQRAWKGEYDQCHWGGMEEIHRGNYALTEQMI